MTGAGAVPGPARGGDWSGRARGGGWSGLACRGVRGLPAGVYPGGLVAMFPGPPMVMSPGLFVAMAMCPAPARRMVDRRSHGRGLPAERWWICLAGGGGRAEPLAANLPGSWAPTPGPGVVDSPSPWSPHRRPVADPYGPWSLTRPACGRQSANPYARGRALTQPVVATPPGPGCQPAQPGGRQPARPPVPEFPRRTGCGARPPPGESPGAWLQKAAPALLAVCRCAGGCIGARRCETGRKPLFGCAVLTHCVRLITLVSAIRREGTPRASVTEVLDESGS